MWVQLLVASVGLLLSAPGPATWSPAGAGPAAAVAAGPVLTVRLTGTELPDPPEPTGTGSPGRRSTPVGPRPDPTDHTRPDQSGAGLADGVPWQILATVSNRGFVPVRGARLRYTGQIDSEAVDPATVTFCAQPGPVVAPTAADPAPSLVVPVGGECPLPELAPDARVALPAVLIRSTTATGVLGGLTVTVVAGTGGPALAVPVSARLDAGTAGAAHSGQFGSSFPGHHSGIGPGPWAPVDDVPVDDSGASGSGTLAPPSTLDAARGGDGSGPGAEPAAGGPPPARAGGPTDVAGPRGLVTLVAGAVAGLAVAVGLGVGRPVLLRFVRRRRSARLALVPGPERRPDGWQTWLA